MSLGNTSTFRDPGDDELAKASVNELLTKWKEYKKSVVS